MSASRRCWEVVGPAHGTFVTTCTPGPWHTEMMLRSADAFPMNGLPKG